MIGICYNFCCNYGTALQNLALISFLEDHNIKYEFIKYNRPTVDKYFHGVISFFCNPIFRNIKLETLTKKIKFWISPDFAKKQNIRKALFYDFAQKNFSNIRIVNNYNNLCNAAKKYDAVMVGSDQVWLPTGSERNFFNLKFVPSNIIKIAFAPSFGVSFIPKNQIKKTKEYLSRIEYISTRENRGAEIVKELTGKIVPTVLDPIFMFDKNGWDKLIPNKQIYNFEYIFAYFLGNNTVAREEVLKFAKKENLKIVTLKHLDQFVPVDENFGDIAPFDVSPNDFLNILRNAKYIFTDSFHGMCLSVIHKKQFMIFNRRPQNSIHSSNSRIDSLCENLNL